MQMIAKKVTYSYDDWAVGNPKGKGTFDHPDLNIFKKTGLKNVYPDLGRNAASNCGRLHVVTLVSFGFGVT